MSRKILIAACMTAFVAALAVPQADAGPRKKREAESSEGPTREVVGRNEVEGEIIGNEIPDSPFTKLEIGMSVKQVRETIGKDVHDDAECGSYFTGKSFIPFHFGGDKMRQECAYEGLGRLVFTNQSDFNDRAVLIKIEYDASEDGYRDD